MMKRFGFGLICAAALLYLAVANGRGYVPFGGPPGRYVGGTGHSAGVFLFHK